MNDTQRATRPAVGLNAHLLSLADTYRSAGIHGYIAHLLRLLPDAAPDLDFTAYLHDRRFSPPARLTVDYSRWPTGSPWRRIPWEQARLPIAARAARLRLLHGLAFVAPLRSPCPTVVTVHDLSFIRFPRAFRAFNRYYLTWFTRLSVRRAARVIAVSQHTADDLRQMWGIPTDRIAVVPNGLDAAFRPADAADVADARARYGMPPRFVLFLGTLEPRKNLTRLVRAYAATHAAADGVTLVIAGGQGWCYREIYREVERLGLAAHVHFTGYLPGEQIAAWYRAAEVFVYPSLYEGFGIPVLEAMACGTPVVTTTASSLPEVAGDAALLVEPTDEAALTGALARLLQDAALRATLRAKGLQRAALFSWQRTADETARVYRAVLGET